MQDFIRYTDPSVLRWAGKFVYRFLRMLYECTQVSLYRGSITQGLGYIDDTLITFQYSTNTCVYSTAVIAPREHWCLACLQR